MHEFVANVLARVEGRESPREVYFLAEQEIAA
jgi:hypothetical protein